MLGTKWKISILRKLISSGNVKVALLFCFRVLKGKLFGGYTSNIYTLAAALDSMDSIDQSEGYIVKSFNSWEELDEPYIVKLSQYDYFKGGLIQNLFEEKANFWIGIYNRKITNFGWSRLGSTVKKWYFPLAPNWVVLSHFETLAEQRGKGLYPQLIANIIRRLNKQGLAEGYIIDSDDWNIPSINGIEKLNFKLIGYGTHKSGDRFCYFQRSTPDFISNS